MSYDSITNRRDYLSPHYLAEVLPRDLKKPAACAPAGPTGRKRASRPRSGDCAAYAGSTSTLVCPSRKTSRRSAAQRQRRCRAERSLASRPGLRCRRRRDWTVERAGEVYQVPVAYAGQNVIAVDCDWAADTDAAFDADGARQAPHPGRGRQPGDDRDRREARPLAVRGRRAAALRPAAARRRDRPCRPAHLGRRQVPGGQPRRRLERADDGRARDDRRPVQRRRAAAARRRRRNPSPPRRRLAPARRRRLR